MNNFVKLLNDELSFLSDRLEFIVKTSDKNISGGMCVAFMENQVSIYLCESKKMSEIEAIKASFRRNKFARQFTCAEIEKAIKICIESYERQNSKTRKFRIAPLPSSLYFINRHSKRFKTR